jgi:CheY-like chemotaxis protein
VIADKTDGSVNRRRGTIEPLRVALRDFAAELAHGTGRRFTVELSDDEPSIDARLLSTTALVLQSMITDIFSRSGVGDVRVDIAARDSNGALRWTLNDDGGNFISDSPLDHEDQLAFYPGLRSVINLIARHRAVLWVEPPADGKGPRCRFEFTLPASDSHEALVLWGRGPEAFALRATQVCAILDGAAAARRDEYGEYLEVDGARVPLIQLDELYEAAPGRGDAVVVLGALEKRIAFYVPSQWKKIDAHVHSGAVPPWEGAPPYVAHVDERRVALLDADYVVNGYHSVTGTMSTDAISGGVPEDEPEVNPRQATSREDDPAPPANEENRGEGGSLDVLIVEQSETMQDTLTSILSELNLEVECASEVDEALDLVTSRTPRLVISEFRMPTMAAKCIVDRLGEAGTGIPVLVTTSQIGVTADLLVEKLGASGHLSKPLDAAEVAARVSAHLGEGAAR